MNAHAATNRQVRRLRSEDLPAVTAIFNEALGSAETTADVEYRSAGQVAAWLTGDKPEYEAFVCEDSDDLVGWAAITRYHEREAYSPTVELSVYVAKRARKAGIGRMLMRTVLNRAVEAGFHSAVLILFSEPEFVLDRAKRLGFRELGRLSGVYPDRDGFRDIVLLQLIFGREEGTRS